MTGPDQEYPNHTGAGPPVWMQACHHFELWYIGNEIATIDDRLCSITPPNEIQRTPRSIELTVKFWKGLFSK